MKKILCLALASLMLLILFVPMVSAQLNGPVIDVLRLNVIQSPDQRLFQMHLGLIDVAPSLSTAMDLCPVPEAEADSLLRTNDIETLNADGDLVTQDMAYHVGFIGYNIRDLNTIHATWRTDVNYWPLHDVEFRHALIHCYDQLGICAGYGYTVTPVRSLVPQDPYPNVPKHPYNPGNPANPAAQPSTSTQILRDAGYTFVDIGTVGTVDDADYWKCPDGSPMPKLMLWTPLLGVAPASFGHGAAFVADLTAIGLGATTANGEKGFSHLGRDFNEYLNEVYGTSVSPGGRFDAFMDFFNFGRLPTQLFSLCHATQDVAVEGQWGRRNSVGMNDATIDALTYTVKYSNNPNDIEGAERQVQIKLYEPGLPNADYFALAYMCLYSRSHFNAYNYNLGGIVKSHGYGSNNKWTFLNIHWAGTPRTEDGRTVVIWALSDYPDSFNPCYAATAYEWEILEQVYDGLTNVNPYNHYDIASLATEWSIVEVGAGMDIYFTLRSDVEWQDRYAFTASDVEFCLEFLRDHHVPRYAETWETLTDVEVVDATHVIIHSNAQGVGLFYDYAGIAALLPPQAWDRDWETEFPGVPVDQAVLNYDPSVPYDPAPGYAAGPTPPPTNLFGTGPWIFQFYDQSGGTTDFWRNPTYWMSQVDIAALMTDMFWEVGDGNKDGIVDVEDYTHVNFRYGSFVGDPLYLPEWNFNSDDIIDGVDRSIVGYHMEWVKFRDAAYP